MMRKIIVIGLSFISVLLITALIINGCRTKVKNRALSIIKAHNYVMSEENKEIKIPMYFTCDNCYNQRELINDISFANNDESQKISIKIKDIRKTKYAYSFGNDKYYCYEYFLLIPNLENDFSISEAYLVISADATKAKYEIGSLYLLYYPMLGEATNITFNYLLGHSKYNPYQTADYFDMTLENKSSSTIEIKSVWLGDSVKIDYEQKELIGFMKQNDRYNISYNQKIIMDNSFIVINYAIGKEEYRYVIDTYILFDNGYALPTDIDLVKEYVHDRNK